MKSNRSCRELKLIKSILTSRTKKKYINGIKIVKK